VRVLLDTHTFIWSFDSPEKLSPRIRALCLLEDTELVVSVASLWEMQIKLQIGKLELATPIEVIVEQQRLTNGIVVLPVRLPDVVALRALPLVHRDPFDRLLIAQARVESMPIRTADPQFAHYQMEVIS
jgi:PIN domain nuclease of toxin-antitoxin system